MRSIVATIFYLGTLSAFGQRPVITMVEPLSTYPVNRVLITGSGFSNTAANLQVWFGNVKGTIVRAADFSLEVTVPPQARLDNVEVINLISRLSSKSSLKFMPVFSGEGFDPSKLTTPLSFSSTNAIFDMCSCDLNGDNKPDLIGTKFENTATDLIVLENTSTPGNLSFTKLDKSNLSSLTINAPTGHITCGDLNGDGKPDVVASRSGTAANSIFVIRNISTTSPDFASPVELFLETGHFARQVSINDLNGDGKPEIIVANSFNNILYVFVNQSSGGTLSINPTPVKIAMAGVPNSLALEVQDMDGDGKPDIVLTQNQGPNVYLLKNQSAGSISFAAPTVITIPGSFNDVTSADFNNDGKLDLVVTSVFNLQILVLMNQSTAGTFSFSAPLTLTSGSGPFGVDVSDINGDGFPDIVVPNRGAATMDVFLHNKNASPGFSRVVVNTAKANWFTVTGDLDGDAKPDIAFTSFNSIALDFTIDILRNRNCHLPQILKEAPLTICVGQTIELNAIPAPAVTFNWRNGPTSIKNSADPFADITAAGTYTVTATGEGGACVVSSAPLVVSPGVGTVPGKPVINPITPACTGATLTITTSSVTGATYLWDGPGGFTASTAVPSLSIPNVTAAHAGLYTLRVKTGDCVSDPDTKEAQVVDLGTFTISSTAAGPLCSGQSAVLSVNSATDHTYQWIRNGTNITGQTSNTLTVNQEGVYKVRVTFTGCSREIGETSVIILTKPVASFSVASAGCIGEPLTFTNTTAVDNRATVAYTWNFGDGQTSSAQSPVYSYSAVGMYSPMLTVSYEGAASCSDSNTGPVSISDASPPVIIAEASEICPGDKTMLSISGVYNTITWSTNETASFIVVSQPATYSVTTVDAGGCVGVDEITLDTRDGCGAIVITIPKMFSPNGDTKNDRWIIPGIEEYPDCTMKIFDDKGVGIFQQTGYPLEGWDGLHDNGKPVPDGVYFYIFSCPNRTPVTGAVTVLR